MDSYLFEKLVGAQDGIFCHQGKEMWTVELVFLYGGKLDFYFRPYAEINPVELNTKRETRFFKKGKYRWIRIFRICKAFFNKLRKKGTIRDEKLSRIWLPQKKKKRKERTTLGLM